MGVRGLNNIIHQDVANADVSKGVMLALLPMVTDWCTVDCPHMTLVYAGTTDTLKEEQYKELTQDASMLAALSSPLTLKVKGVQQVGDTEKVDALTFQPTQELLAMRRAVEKWNASQFPFDPHSTIGPVGSMPPSVITPRVVAFDRLMVGWGNDRIVFRLGRSNSNLY